MTWLTLGIVLAVVTRAIVRKGSWENAILIGALVGSVAWYLAYHLV